MAWNLNSRSSEWDWETEIPKNLVFTSHENDMVEETTVLSGEEMIGLKLGRQTYCRDKTSHSPRCQVEGCNLDLVSAKDYHRRHKICANHSKSPKVVVAGMERRFCQQCSRLHDLSEFDERKRSCRRRLSAHNARRRRPSEDVHLNSTHRKPHMSVLMNRVSSSSPSSTPESSSNYKARGADIMPNGAVLENSLSFQGVTPRSVNHDGMEENSNSIYAMGVRQAFSIQTMSCWEEPPSFEQFMQGQNIGLTLPGMPLEFQNNRNTQIPPNHFNGFSSN